MVEQAGPTSSDDLGEIRRAFAELFEADDITLPDELPAEGSFSGVGWSFRYRINHVDGSACLDVVAQHAGDDQLWRIRADGEVEPGPSFRSMVIFDPDVDMDEADARRRFDTHNAHVGDVMRERGLL